MEKLTAENKIFTVTVDGTAALPIGDHVTTSVLLLHGLDCADCAAKLEEKIARLEGVLSAKVNFGAAKMKVEHISSVQEIIKAVKDYGYGADIEKQTGGQAETVFRIHGLDCADCAAKLEKSVCMLAGVQEVSLNFATGKMKVIHNIPVSAILQAVSARGYRAEEEGPGSVVKDRSDRQERVRLYNTIASGLLLIGGFLAQIAGLDQMVEFFYLSAIISGGYHMAKSGLYALKSLTMDMNFLMTMAVTGAIAIGEFSEAATVVFLFALGNLMQNYVLEKTRRSIRSLIDLSPREAMVKRDGREITVPVEDVLKGEIVIVRPGENIPVDGVVLSGESPVNQSPITGESMPVMKVKGATVFAGTINGGGALEIETAKIVADSKLFRIIHLVEEAQAQKAPSQQIVDVFARYYTPAVIVSALALAVLPTAFFGMDFGDWFKKALILLVIACPCALIISTPVSIISAIGSAARKGVLIKGGAFLEEAGRIKVMAFDKTGTLTRGRPEVTAIDALNGYSERDVLIAAAAIESRSEHPLAGAVLRKLEQENLQAPTCSNFSSLAGKGAGAELNGIRYYIGNEQYFDDIGISYLSSQGKLDALRQNGWTALLVGNEKDVMGIIAAADQIREDSALTVKKLRESGIARMVMLTGDNGETAREVALSTGFDEYMANLLPDEKLVAISGLKKSGKVAMVGDGINDAPALAAADIGIAMGGAGTDTAIETADIALMSDDLSKLPYTIKLSRKAVCIIKQNITFSLLIKAVFIIATLSGYATLWMAVFADTGTSLLVTFNGMRLMRVRDNQ